MRTLQIICIPLLSCLSLGLLGCEASAPGNNIPGAIDAKPGDPPGPGTPDAKPNAPDASTVKFSFFVTSLATMRKQSGSQDGFGGNLGGLVGADRICQTAAADQGFGYKTWKAYLSTTTVNAIDRIGNGPWYDRNARLVAMNKAGLISGSNRPAGDAATVSDLPDETGAPLEGMGDTHDIMTGSNRQGKFGWVGLGDNQDNVATSAIYSCMDWTSSSDSDELAEKASIGHSWPSNASGRHWSASHQMRGCAPGINLVQDGAGQGNCVGCGGGWGAIYCFADQP